MSGSPIATLPETKGNAMKYVIAAALLALSYTYASAELRHCPTCTKPPPKVVVQPTK